jgi:hypothetical protein
VRFLLIPTKSSNNTELQFACVFTVWVLLILNFCLYPGLWDISQLNKRNICVLVLPCATCLILQIVSVVKFLSLLIIDSSLNVSTFQKVLSWWSWSEHHTWRITYLNKAKQNKTFGSLKKKKNQQTGCSPSYAGVVGRRITVQVKEPRPYLKNN